MAAEKLGQGPLGDVLWPGLEKHYAHLHLGPLAAFFTLAEAHHDVPLGYHAPPPLAPMVHYGRSPIEVPLRAVSTLVTEHADSPAAKIKPDRVPLDGLASYARLSQDRDDEAVCHCGVMLLRKLISVDENPPLAAVVATNIVPRLVELVEAAPDSQIVFEALWALTNIASGTSAEMNAVMTANGFQAVIKQANTTTSDDVAEQAAWALGNLAGEGVHYRDFSIGLGAISALLSLIERFPHCTKAVTNATWALSNHCRGKPLPPLDPLRAALPVLFNLLHHREVDVRCDAAWALSFVSDGPSDRVAAVLPALPALVPFLEDPKSTLVTPTIRTIGNIATGTDVQTTVLLDHGVLRHFPSLITDGSRAVRKETCWTLSNITAGNVEQIQAVIDAGLVPMLMRVIESDTTEHDVLKEAIWAVANLTSGGSAEQIQHAVESGLLRCLPPRLRNVADPKLIQVIFETLDKTFNQYNDSKKEEDWRTAARESGAVGFLCTAATTLRPDLAQQALAILTNYFPEDADALDGAADPAGGEENAFSFGNQAAGEEVEEEKEDESEGA